MYCGTEWLVQVFTSKCPFIEALLDAVSSADMEGLGDLLVHEAFSVQDIGYHHSQVKHLKKLRDGGHLHQIPTAFIQTARVQVLQHRLEPQQI